MHVEGGLHSVVVESRFSATHHIRLHDGSVEPPHGHDWHVRVTFARASLDSLGMVIDFAEAGRLLKKAIEPLNYSNLNELAALRGKNPTTEVVAEWIFHRIFESGGASLAHVEVTEAPGCMAIYEPG